MGARSGGGGGAGFGKYYNHFSPTVSINQSNGQATVSFNKYGDKSKKKSHNTFNNLKNALTFANKLSKQGFNKAVDWSAKPSSGLVSFK